MAETRLIPPKNGVTVRFYRIGHGDCFLLAFATKKPSRPTYVLIDCGYKPGSPGKIDPPTDPADVVADIAVATGGRIDVFVVTHEHQDHLNAITAANFTGIEVGQTWLAWTEDDNDAVANALRAEYNDRLYALVAARHRLAGVADLSEAASRIDRLLESELGFDASRDALPAAGALFGALNFGDNKRSLKLARDLAGGNVQTIRPHEDIMNLPDVEGVRVFALGPPRPETMEEAVAIFRQDDPASGSDQAFPRLTFGVGTLGAGFAAAATAAPGATGLSPFATRYGVPVERLAHDAADGRFFSHHYGHYVDGKVAYNQSVQDAARVPARGEVPDDAEWRRIDNDWLLAAEQLALDAANFHNNTSLVLAFELGKGGKVLLFAADAQLGNWLSWVDNSWTDDDGDEITVRDLLARTVLYKVGHHGSHNGTLNGRRTDAWPNLDWMAVKPKHAREFVAMITAVPAWAKTQPGWHHPLPSIKAALLDKAAGRVLQTDTPRDDMSMPEDGEPSDWQAFQSRTIGEHLFFDLTITR